MNIASEKRKSSFYDISQRSGEGLETLLSVKLDQYMYTLDRAIVSALKCIYELSLLLFSSPSYVLS